MKNLFLFLGAGTLLFSCAKIDTTENESNLPSTDETFRTAATIDGFTTDATVLKTMADDPELDFFKLIPIVDADPDDGVADLGGFDWVGVHSDDTEHPCSGTTPENRSFDINILNDLPEIPASDIEAQGPVLSNHILQPYLAYDFINDWKELYPAGEITYENVSYDGELINYYVVEKEVVQALATGASVDKVVIYPGLNAEDKLTPVFISVDDTNTEMLTGGNYSYDFVRPCPRFCGR